MNKKTQSILAAVLALIMIVSLLIALLPPVRAEDLDKDAMQEQVEELSKRRDELEKEKTEKQAIVDDLEAKEASVLELKQALDERNAYIRAQIELNNEELRLYESIVLEKEEELKAAISLEEQQLERYRVRVRAMEENGEYDFLALLLNTTNLGELLTTIDDIGEIMESDRQLEDDYISARERSEQAKAEYEQVKADLQTRQSALIEEQRELDRQIQEATDHINELIEEIQITRSEINALDEEQQEKQAEMDALIEELERQRAEEERRRQEEEERRRQEEEARRAAQQQSHNQPTPADDGGYDDGGYDDGGYDDGGYDDGGYDDGGYDDGGSYGASTATGSFGWPCPGCYYVTSRMGNRFHPIFNEWRYHSGMDIGAGFGSAIVASDGGTVCLAGENGGYGNCVMIDHGNGYYTLYGHMSSYACSYGDTVSKGQTIGYVGDTGWATGPHLHFEIRYGDTCLDPEVVGGFGGLSYAPDAGE